LNVVSIEDLQKLFPFYGTIEVLCSLYVKPYKLQGFTYKDVREETVQKPIRPSQDDFTTTAEYKVAEGCYVYESNVYQDMKCELMFILFLNYQMGFALCWAFLMREPTKKYKFMICGRKFYSIMNDLVL
jgi:hypothetical protein